MIAVYFLTVDKKFTTKKIISMTITMVIMLMTMIMMVVVMAEVMIKQIKIIDENL